MGQGRGREVEGGAVPDWAPWWLAVATFETELQVGREGGGVWCFGVDVAVAGMLADVSERCPVQAGVSPGYQMAQEQPLGAGDMPAAPLLPHLGSATTVFPRLLSDFSFLPQDLWRRCSCCLAGSASPVPLDVTQRSAPFSAAAS